MTDPEPANAGSSGGAEMELHYQDLLDLINGAVSRTRYWWAAEILDDVRFDDAEVDALRKMPLAYRQRATAQLIDVSEVIREALRDLDGQLMRLTGELV